MNEFYWHGNKLKNQLDNLNSISSLKIATAYFSEYGLNVLESIIDKNKLSKNQVELYLSPEFSKVNPGELLEKLSKISRVYIVYDIPFHPKVIFAEGKSKNILIFGSSNFTGGGIEENIEFDAIKTATSEEIQKLNLFFDFCSNSAKLITNETVLEYKENQQIFDELRRLEREVRKRFYDKYKKDDPLHEDEFDLSDYYFNFHDYEILFPRNSCRDDVIIRKQRKNLQDKILYIHNNIYNQIKKLKLYCHWRKDNITSQIRPCVFNKGKVNWIGVRYGKSEDEVRALNEGVQSRDEELGFQKHACLQFSISSDGFEVNLFHAVSHDAIDRDWVHKKLLNKEYREALVKEIKRLKGRNLVWKIYDSVSDTLISEFQIDEKAPDDFIKFYIDNDMDGRESFLAYFLRPDSPELKDINTISKMIIEKITLMLPLYKIMAFRLK